MASNRLNNFKLPGAATSRATPEHAADELHQMWEEVANTTDGIATKRWYLIAAVHSSLTRLISGMREMHVPKQ